MCFSDNENNMTVFSWVYRSEEQLESKSHKGETGETYGGGGYHLDLELHRCKCLFNVFKRANSTYFNTTVHNLLKQSAI